MKTKEPTYKKNLRLFASTLLLLLYANVVNGQTLKDHFQGVFDIGVALGYRDFNGQESRAEQLIGKHFNSITPENIMKWGPIHPNLNQYNFQGMDQLVALAERVNASVIGHTLVWHNQTPHWVYHDERGNLLPKEGLLQRMDAHIETVMGRYKGRIKGYDVVNEAILDDGTYRESNWYQIAGKDFIKQAFVKASEVDPDAELYYNDYNMWKAPKRETAIALALELREAGIKIDGIGMQGHYGLESPSLDTIEASITRIAEAGFKVMITELDIDVLPNPVNRFGADIDATFPADESYNIYKDGLPDEIKQKLADRYQSLFELFTKHQDKIDRVTFWGLHDGSSWLNNWPMPGRTAYPLIIDRHFREKAEIIESLMTIQVETNNSSIAK
ncbi:endo-1,4-beta-xylanase [Mongoliitalea daihaiensis]|uniref:endo-1,4-beta-xylanase n=1 Tax=Mongoliitalea daihaiensis TaxID=2782006 RepID=UPI001F3B0EC3|nr:endo-1,4-beta-xylanase [Mongoliitalea daihaiensis]UJP65068.1 endo-1,4-beta-xylanase [Mongoliitalea daihaiensis]